MTCYWAVVELGIPMVELVRKFDIAPAGVRYAVQRGEKMTKERGYQLETRLI
jgi:transcriptional regulator CtsR